MTPETSLSLLSEIKTTTNQVAWERFSRIYFNLIHSWCEQCGLNHEDSLDLTQEVLIRIFERIKDYTHQGKGSFRNWLRRVIQNCFANFKSKRAELPMPAEELEAALGGVFNNHWEEDFPKKIYQEAYRTLSVEFETDTWRAFELTQIHNHSVNEAAAMLNCTTNVIYISRCRVILRLIPYLKELID